MSTEPTSEELTSITAGEEEKPTTATATAVDAVVLKSSEKPDAEFGDYEVVRLEGECLQATYGPTEQTGKDVTDEINALFKKNTTILYDGIHTHIGDPFPGEVKVLRLWFNKDTVAQNIFTLGNKPKSLFLALVFVNPFDEVRKNSDPEDRDENGKMKLQAPHQPDAAELAGYEATEYNPATHLRDDDFLHSKGLLAGSAAPNNFQKMIEFLLRLKKRGLTVLPPDVLEEGDASADMPWNHFDGHRLNESKMFLSPDKDETYFKIHANREVLLEFAEHQHLTLRTNPYSFGGGGGMIYSKQLSDELEESVRGYMKHFEIPEQDGYCRGKQDEDGNYRGWGFCVEVPQKMRLLVRLLREGWVFGGCGLQLDEMKEKATFLKNYFPIHNKAYQKAYGIDDWSNPLTFFNPCTALADTELALIHYFGEQIAMYFSWLREYDIQLIGPAFVGVLCGALQEGFRTADLRYYDIIGGCFGAFMVIWGVAWIRKWERAEKRFAVRWGQYVEAQDELVRDEFEYEDKKPVDVKVIYTLDFEYPLTMQRLPDGTMVELVFPGGKRNKRRYLISYPIMAILAAGMVAALLYTEFYRFDHAEDTTVSVGASIVSVLITTIFTKVSAVLIDMLNDYENCRTDQEYDDEVTRKSFAFTFVSTYFSVFVISLWPTIANMTRVRQLKAQMIVQQVAMPMVGNVVELLLPVVMTSLQRRIDSTGGFCSAICSYFCCCCSCESCTGCQYSGKEVRPENEREEQGLELWSQSSRQPYLNTCGDYLEICLTFGYMMMFASVFPWAGLAAFFYTSVELRVDAWKLVNSFQRPVARTATTVGSWNDIMWALTGISIVTNSYYVTVISNAAHQAGMKTNFAKILEYFSYLQYFLAVAVLLLSLVRTPESPSFKKAGIRTQLLNDRAIQEYVKKTLAMSKEELAEVTETALKAINDKEDDECCDCFLFTKDAGEH